MGFRKDAYATVWEVEPASDVRTKGRISISKRNKTTGEYETEFQGFVNFLGSVAAKKAATLKERDRIKIGDCDVNNNYNKEKNITYYNFNIFSFEDANGGTTSGGSNSVETTVSNADNGEIDDSAMPW